MIENLGKPELIFNNGDQYKVLLNQDTVKVKFRKGANSSKTLIAIVGKEYYETVHVENISGQGVYEREFYYLNPNKDYEVILIGISGEDSSEWERASFRAGNYTRIEKTDGIYKSSISDVIKGNNVNEVTMSVMIGNTLNDLVIERRETGTSNSRWQRVTILSGLSSNKLHKVTLKEFDHSKIYDFRVRGILTDGSKSVWSEKIGCGIISNVASVTVEGQKGIIQMDFDQGVYYADVYVWEKGQLKPQNPKTSGETFEIHGLKPNTEYNYTIVYRTINGVEIHSYTGLFKTPDKPRLCQVKKLIQGTNIMTYRKAHVSYEIDDSEGTEVYIIKEYIDNKENSEEIGSPKKINNNDYIEVPTVEQMNNLNDEILSDHSNGHKPEGFKEVIKYKLFGKNQFGTSEIVGCAKDIEADYAFKASQVGEKKFEVRLNFDHLPKDERMTYLEKLEVTVSHKEGNLNDTLHPGDSNKTEIELQNAIEEGTLSYLIMDPTPSDYFTNTFYVKLFRDNEEIYNRTTYVKFDGEMYRRELALLNMGYYTKAPTGTSINLSHYEEILKNFKKIDNEKGKLAYIVEEKGGDINNLTSIESIIRDLGERSKDSRYGLKELWKVFKGDYIRNIISDLREIGITNGSSQSNIYDENLVSSVKEFKDKLTNKYGGNSQIKSEIDKIYKTGNRTLTDKNKGSLINETCQDLLNEMKFINENIIGETLTSGTRKRLNLTMGESVEYFDANNSPIYLEFDLSFNNIVDPIYTCIKVVRNPGNYEFTLGPESNSFMSIVDDRIIEDRRVMRIRINYEERDALIEGVRNYSITVKISENRFEEQLLLKCYDESVKKDMIFSLSDHILKKRYRALGIEHADLNDCLNEFRGKFTNLSSGDLNTKYNDTTLMGLLIGLTENFQGAPYGSAIMMRGIISDNVKRLQEDLRKISDAQILADFKYTASPNGEFEEYFKGVVKSFQNAQPTYTSISIRKHTLLIDKNNLLDKEREYIHNENICSFITEEGVVDIRTQNRIKELLKVKNTNRVFPYKIGDRHEGIYELRQKLISLSKKFVYDSDNLLLSFDGNLAMFKFDNIKDSPHFYDEDMAAAIQYLKLVLSNKFKGDVLDAEKTKEFTEDDFNVLNELIDNPLKLEKIPGALQYLFGASAGFNVETLVYSSKCLDKYTIVRPTKRVEVSDGLISFYTSNNLDLKNLGKSFSDEKDESGLIRVLKTTEIKEGEITNGVIGDIRGASLKLCSSFTSNEITEGLLKGKKIVVNTYFSPQSITLMFLIKGDAITTGVKYVFKHHECGFKGLREAEAACIARAWFYDETIKGTAFTFISQVMFSFLAAGVISVGASYAIGAGFNAVAGIIEGGLALSSTAISTAVKGISMGIEGIKYIKNLVQSGGVQVIEFINKIGAENAKELISVGTSCTLAISMNLPAPKLIGASLDEESIPNEPCETMFEKLDPDIGPCKTFGEGIVPCVTMEEKDEDATTCQGLLGGETQPM